MHGNNDIRPPDTIPFTDDDGATRYFHRTESAWLCRQRWYGYTNVQGVCVYGSLEKRSLRFVATGEDS